RSAGARVACRTARALDAHAVLALAFPLHPPGRPESSRADELPDDLPTLVVQGGNDSFGKPAEFPRGGHRMVEVPWADHSFAVPKRAATTQEDALATVVDGVARWLGGLSG
ncbi:alpha/beta family hydrolase, partial [Streptomyces sp. Act-28]